MIVKVIATIGALCLLGGAITLVVDANDRYTRQACYSIAAGALLLLRFG